MLLAVDVGNTNVVFGIYEDSCLEHTFRTSTDPNRTVDEQLVLLDQLLSLRGLKSRVLDGAIIASVVPALTDLMVQVIRTHFAREPLVVGPGLKTGMPILYDNPREVGADRIANAVAAYERVHDACIVVDFGTATTFDCISGAGEYLGGVIAPGMLVSLDGLLAHAAKLSRIEIAEPPRVLGRNTTHAMQSGVVHGYASLVDGVVDKLRAEMGVTAAVLATGGLASTIAKFTRVIDNVDPNLTLDGLRLIHERNLRTVPSSPTAIRRPVRSS